MSNVFIKRTRTKQPTSHVKVDWSNVITKGLYSATIAGLGDVLNPSYRFGGDTVLWSGPKERILAQATVDTFAPTAINFPKKKLSARTEIFGIFYSSRKMYGQWWASYGRDYLGGEYSETEIRYGIHSDEWGVSADIFSGNSVSLVGAPRVICALWNKDKNSGYGRVFVDGVEVVRTGGAPYSGISDRSLSAGSTGGPNQGSGGISFFYAFDRDLSDIEVFSLSKNPWQIFEPETIPLFVPAGTGPVTHPTTGDVVGNTATVTGSALRETGAQTHPSTGDVVGNTATVNGTALRYRAHATTGVVAGLTSTVTGTALRYRLHETTGVVTGLTSTVTGSATIQPAPGIHVSTGDVVAGTGSVSGTALHIGVHPTTGVLAGFSAEVVGAAQRSGAVIVHGTSGVLAGYDSVVTGAATNQGSMTLTPADIQAIVAAIKAEIMPVNIVRVNNIDVDGTGADSDPWGPV